MSGAQLQHGCGLLATGSEVNDGTSHLKPCHEFDSDAKSASQLTAADTPRKIPSDYLSSFVNHAADFHCAVHEELWSLGDGCCQGEQPQKHQFNADPITVDSFEKLSKLPLFKCNKRFLLCSLLTCLVTLPMAFALTGTHQGHYLQRQWVVCLPCLLVAVGEMVLAFLYGKPDCMLLPAASYGC